MEFLTKLNGTNYQEWSGWIEMKLKDKQAYEVIEKKVENIGTEEVKAYERLNVKAMVLFLSSMDDYHMELVCGFEYAFDVWHFLLAMYGNKDVVKCGGGGDGNFDGRRGSVNGRITEVEHMDARVTPDIGVNVISVGQLPEEGSEESRGVIERITDQSSKEAPFDVAISEKGPCESSAVDARGEASAVDVFPIDVSGDAIFLMCGWITEEEHKDAWLTPDMGVFQTSVGQLAEEMSQESRGVNERATSIAFNDTEEPHESSTVDARGVASSVDVFPVDARGEAITVDSFMVDASGEAILFTSNVNLCGPLEYQAMIEAPVDVAVVNDEEVNMEPLESCLVGASGVALKDDKLTVDDRGEMFILASGTPIGVNELSETQADEQPVVRSLTQVSFEVSPLCHGATAVLETAKISESHKEAVDLIHAEEWRNGKLDELDSLFRDELELVENPLVENQSTGVFEDEPNGLEHMDARTDLDIWDGILKEMCRVSQLHFYHQLVDCRDEFFKLFEENKKYSIGYSPEVT